MKKSLYALASAFVLSFSQAALADIDVRKGGSSWAKIENDGTVRINGSSVGKIESDGTVRKNGSSVGKVDSDGTIRKGSSSWGSASNCCGDHGSKRAVAALIAFFSGEFF
jgi:hypothetical protein